MFCPQTFQIVSHLASYRFQISVVLKIRVKLPSHDTIINLRFRYGINSNEGERNFWHVRCTRSMVALRASSAPASTAGSSRTQTELTSTTLQLRAGSRRTTGGQSTDDAFQRLSLPSTHTIRLQPMASGEEMCRLWSKLEGRGLGFQSNEVEVIGC